MKKAALCKSHWRQQQHGEELKPLRRKNGSTWVTDNGYARRSAVGHPNANALGQILEHRFVMSNHLGRALLPDETVHHKDGNRENNAIENLELWSTRHPVGQRVSDLTAFAVEHLQAHAPHLLQCSENVLPTR